MRLIIALCLILSFTNVLAKNINIKCWSKDKLIFDQFIPENDVSFYDNYLLITKGNTAHIITADCIVTQKI